MAGAGPGAEECRVSSLPVSGLRIIIFGKNATDTYRVGNLLFGGTVFNCEAHGELHIETSRGKLKDRDLTVIYTPDLLQSDLSNSQIAHGVRTCVGLSAPGPHAFILVLQQNDFCEKDRRRVKHVLNEFCEEAIKHTVALTDEEEIHNNCLCKLIKECGGHVQFSPQNSEVHSKILGMIEKILEEEEVRFLICDLYEESRDEEEQRSRPETSVSEGHETDGKKVKEDTSKEAGLQRNTLLTKSFDTLPKLNVVLCGHQRANTASISQLILNQNQMDRRSPELSMECVKMDGEVCGRLITVVELPALTGLSQEEVMRQAHRCVSLCVPGVHVFLLVLPDGPLTEEDKTEMETIQRIFSSKINTHTITLIIQESETRAEELNEAVKTIIESFGGRHHFLEPNTQGLTLVNHLEQVVEENGKTFFCTETFLEAQMEKLEEMRKKVISLETEIQHIDFKEALDEVRIVLLGKTGVGKSATGNTILGREDAFEEDVSQTSVTKECHRQMGDIDGRTVTVIDTPGLFDTNLSHEKIQAEITYCISMILPGPHVFLLLIPVGHYSQEDENIVKNIQDSFGEILFKYTMVLFIRGDNLKKKSIETYLGEPGSPLRTLIEQCGNRYHVFNNNQRDRVQVTTLLQKISDMVTANGGSYYTCKMFRQMERAQMKMLQDKVEQLSRENQELLEKLEEKEKMNKAKDEYHHEFKKEREEMEKIEFQSADLMSKYETKTTKIKMNEDYDEEVRKRDKIINNEEKHRKEMSKKEEQIHQHTEMIKKLEKEKQKWNKHQETLEKELHNCEERIKILKQKKQDGLMRDNPEAYEEDRRKDMENIKMCCFQTDSSLQRDETGQNLKLGTKNEELNELYDRLDLTKRRQDKIGTVDVLQITSFRFQEPQNEKELVKSFLRKLIDINYKAIYTIIKHRKTTATNHGKGKSVDYETAIHPMDVQMAAFHCADGFLKQMMVTKLSQCQYALPLLVPDPLTQQIEFPLWTFRQVKKSWKTRTTNNETISQTQAIYKAKTPMVSFFRFGSMSSSKSQLVNNLINEKHNTFFHRNCSGGSRTRLLMDGVVEIAWYCPSGGKTDTFDDCVAFCNLHGDASANEKPYAILSSMASVNVLFLPDFWQKNHYKGLVRSLFRSPQPLICLLTDSDCQETQLGKGKLIIGLLDKNQSDLCVEIREIIRQSLTEQKKTFSLEDVAKHTGIRVDEDDPECRRAKDSAVQIMGLLRGKDPSTVKDTHLPCHGKLWHDWCKANKDLHHLRGKNMEEDKSTKLKNMREIREMQVRHGLSGFMRRFIETIHSKKDNEKIFFLTWMNNLLDEFTSNKLCELHKEYGVKWQEISGLNSTSDKADPLHDEQTNLENISEQISRTNFGLEHIMRELGQIYESRASLKKTMEGQQFDFCSLPSLAADMMISGFPMELMDGDTAHVPLTWVTAVLDGLVKKLGDQRVFVLSVLGLQSSGKSTMLNAMFGLQFAISAGRCTRGAFMQLVPVSDQMKTQLKFDYILVLDTEGLRAPELAGRSTTDRDNEMATLVIGLGNLTLINIFGENPCEMQDILQIVVQAFMRMKNVRLNPRCMFVHQNVSAVTAGEQNMEGRRKLQDKLDEMTKTAAKEEVCDAEGFSDVIAFDVQKDVRYFAQLWEGSPPMAPPNPVYCENIQELKETILTYASRSDVLTLAHLKDRIKDLWEALLNVQFVFSFKNSLEITTYKKLETEYSKWTWSLRNAMMEIENKLHNKIKNEAIDDVEETDLQAELRATREEVEKTMTDYFEKDKNAGVLNQWKSFFEIKIKELQDEIVWETKRKLTGVLQQRHLKKKIDAQRTHHENTLFEKSKDLALKLKDKANEEDVIKEEFESFWKRHTAAITRDCPLVEHVDIFRDVNKLLSENDRSLLSNRMKDRKYKDLLRLPSYLTYAQLNKSSGFTAPFKNVCKTLKEKTGFALSKEDEAQIRSLIADVAEFTDKMIQSYDIAQMGYNISHIQELIDHIKARITQHEEEPNVKYVFKDEFFVDLVLYICHRTNKTITDQHKMFMETNDPVLYFERKSQEYYRIFQKLCQGASSTAVFGEFVCNKLKEPIEQSVYRKTARDLADEIKTNCESLNGNRSNLEKHILRRLAEEQDFDSYMTYISNPREHFENFIRAEVSQYITENKDGLQPKLEESVKQLEQKIMNAAHDSTKHDNKDVDSWFTYFTQQLSGELEFSQNLTEVSHDDIEVRFLEDVMKNELSSVLSDIRTEVSAESFPLKLDNKLRPEEILISHFCDCCWVQCPFCAAICTNTIEGHSTDHSVPFHRNNGLNGWFYSGTSNLSIDICTSAVASDRSFYPNSSDDSIPWKEYRKGGPRFEDWSITPDLSDLPYWKWFVCRFQKDLEKYYGNTYEGNGKIPVEWRKYTEEEAIESLNKYI